MTIIVKGTLQIYSCDKLASGFLVQLSLNVNSINTAQVRKHYLSKLLRQLYVKLNVVRFKFHVQEYFITVQICFFSIVFCILNSTGFKKKFFRCYCMVILNTMYFRCGIINYLCSCLHFLTEHLCQDGLSLML